MPATPDDNLSTSTAGAADPAWHVVALYRFVRFADFREWQQPLRELLEAQGIVGTLLLAPEGINGTLAGPSEGIDALLDFLRLDPRFADLDVKRSACDRRPFRKAKVRLKREIVTFGVADVDPLQSVGTYIEPADWNALLDAPGVTLIDTRNDYEVAIGSFTDAVNPLTPTFRDFPAFVAKHLDPQTHRKVAMYCTGGIRCEKSTAYLKSLGFAEVYHLRGGILNYLAQVDPAESKWQGECFVFDQRVSVDHALQPGRHTLCFACGWPVEPEAQTSPAFVPGVSCPRCVDRHTPAQQARFAMRQRQHEAASPL